jgi:hypothetical protein
MKKLILALLVLSTCIPEPALAEIEPPTVEYMESALIAWTHQSPEAMRPWAQAIVSVCTNIDECDLLASQAFVESRFVPWVLDGSCNDPSWRASRRGWERKACDGGLAKGPWQVHDDRFLGATPEFQASEVLEMMRHNPTAWTTWRAARSHAAWWKSKR